MKFAFRSLRRFKNEALIYFFETKYKFGEFLKRPDVEQDLVEMFQNEYNAIEEDFRSDSDVKAELHQRVEELRDKLWEFADKRRDEAETERISIIEDKWIEDQSFILANILVTIVQAEADRYFGSRQIIMDYFKDTNSMLFVDIPKNSIKIPFIAGTNAPPIEVGAPLIAASELASSHRKDQTQNVSVAVVKAPANSVKSVSAKQSEKKSQQAAKSTEPAKVAPPPIAEKDPPFLLDPENSHFPDLQSTIDFLTNALASPEYSIEPILALETKKEGEDKSITDLVKIIQTEETMLQQRIEIVRQNAIETFKECKNKTIEVYLQLDEWIGMRYKSEVEATKDLTFVIREAIEAEQRLPNHILLQGEKLQLDYGTLVFQPKAEAPPEPPTEKPSPDHFTVLQLKFLVKKLTQIAPTGVISTKQMVDFLARTAVINLASDPMPEGYINAEIQQLQQVVAMLDPFETGYISWRKFLLLHSRMLPVEPHVLEDIKHLKNATREEFMNTPLWFESKHPVNPRVFDRAGHLKGVIFGKFV